MKKVLFVILILKSFLIADVSVKYLKTENPAGGMGTWTTIYSVIKDGKKCIYEFSAGVYSGTVYNRCTKKTHEFKVRPERDYAKPYKYKKRNYIDPFIYHMAYIMMSNDKKREAKDKTITSSKNSKGKTIYCSKEFKMCKTEKEVIDFINYKQNK